MKFLEADELIASEEIVEPARNKDGIGGSSAPRDKIYRISHKGYVFITELKDSRKALNYTQITTVVSWWAIAISIVSIIVSIMVAITGKYLEERFNEYMNPADTTSHSTTKQSSPNIPIIDSTRVVVDSVKFCKNSGDTLGPPSREKVGGNH